MKKSELKNIIREELDSLRESYEKREIQTILDSLKDSEFKAGMKLTHEGKSTKTLALDFEQLKKIQKIF